ncbi:MAG: hypothetical protein Q9180_007431, partial [Flavoplaca navasiana]
SPVSSSTTSHQIFKHKAALHHQLTQARNLDIKPCPPPKSPPPAAANPAAKVASALLKPNVPAANNQPSTACAKKPLPKTPLLVLAAPVVPVLPAHAHANEPRLRTARSKVPLALAACVPPMHVVARKRLMVVSCLLRLILLPRLLGLEEAADVPVIVGWWMHWDGVEMIEGGILAS